MTIRNLVINFVESKYTSEYIANVFWQQGIAKVNTISLVPTAFGAKYTRAHIKIESWCDSEVAFNFIQRLKDSSKEARIVHYLDDWWTVKISPNIRQTDVLFTTHFNSEYFERREEKDTMNIFEFNFDDLEIIRELRCRTAPREYLIDEFNARKKRESVMDIVEESDAMGEEFEDYDRDDVWTNEQLEEFSRNRGADNVSYHSENAMENWMKLKLPLTI